MRKAFINQLFLLLIVSFLSISAFAQDKHPVSIDDIFTLKDIQDVQLSPDGSTILYVVSTADFEQNAYNSDIWKIPFIGSEPIQMTTNIKSDYHPRWSSDGNMFAFLF